MTWELKLVKNKFVNKCDGGVSISAYPNAFIAPPGNAYYGISRRKKRRSKEDEETEK